MDVRAQNAKRAFDIIASSVGLAITLPLLCALVILCRLDTKQSGLFRQRRVGRYSRQFTLYKLRTMRGTGGSHVTNSTDARITKFGSILRRMKLDELPQLWNVLRGDMSLVGPRPDMPGYLDRLTGDAKRLQSLRPGITGPASLKYRDEEDLLANVDDPQTYNDTVIWPDKVRLNLRYFDTWSFAGDLRILRQTLFP